MAHRKKDPKKCKHTAACPKYKYRDFKDLDGFEVRKKFPRNTVCPTCGSPGFYYASFAHYIAGDW